MAFGLFQSTFPRGERRYLMNHLEPLPQFQSTFPRGERRNSVVPVMAETLVFQSTFPRGERHRNKLYIVFQSYFNPRSLVGNDRFSLTFRGNTYHFNPRSLVGNDITSSDLSAGIDISIHVPSWGTTITDGTMKAVADFNPRSLVGNDSSTRVKGYAINISIHVPSWGTTLNLVGTSGSVLISIHVPSWGTTGFA